MLRLGCLLMFLSFVGLCVLVVLPVLPFMSEDQWIDDLLQPLVCQPGESITRDQYSTTDSDGTSYSMDVFCMGRDEVRREVTDRWFLISMAGFLSPFLIGLFLVIGGASVAAKKAALAPGVLKVSSVALAAAEEDDTLSERLREIQEAYDQGLISLEEYERLRQATLDKGV